VKTKVLFKEVSGRHRSITHKPRPPNLPTKKHTLYKNFTAPDTHSAGSKEAGFSLEEYSLPEVEKDESFGEKCIKCVHHKKNRSFFMK